MDSHTNKVVIGRHTIIINKIGRTVEVILFTLDYEDLHQDPIFDVVILYMCMYNNQIYIIIVRDVLSVPSMKQNLIPPFSMQESEAYVNITPNVHTIGEQTVDYHATYIPSNNFRILLLL